MPEAAADEAGQEQQQEVDDRTELQLVQAEPISERIAAMLAADGSRGDDMKELKTAADNTKARSKDECLSETVNKLKAKPWQFGYAAALEYMQYVLVLLMIIDDMKKHSQTQNLENWGAKTPTSLLNRMREQYGAPPRQTMARRLAAGALYLILFPLLHLNVWPAPENAYRVFERYCKLPENKRLPFLNKLHEEAAKNPDGCSPRVITRVLDDDDFAIPKKPRNRPGRQGSDDDGDDPAGGPEEPAGQNPRGHQQEQQGGGAGAGGPAGAGGGGANDTGGAAGRADGDADGAVGSESEEVPEGPEARRQRQLAAAAAGAARREQQAARAAEAEAARAAAAAGGGSRRDGADDAQRAGSSGGQGTLAGQRRRSDSSDPGSSCGGSKRARVEPPTQQHPYLTRDYLEWLLKVYAPGLPAVQKMVRECIVTAICAAAASSKGSALDDIEKVCKVGNDMAELFLRKCSTPDEDNLLELEEGHSSSRLVLQKLKLSGHDAAVEVADRYLAGERDAEASHMQLPCVLSSW